MNDSRWKLNTSHLGKFEEFQRLFAQHGCELEASHLDLSEIDADQVTVVAHKASQLAEHTLVDDTSMDIEGASIGIHIRWVIDHLPEYEGRKAVWTVLLAMHHGNQVFIYKGCVAGTIVAPRGANGFGFDPIFLPEGSDQTLAEVKSDRFNARAQAVEALIQGHVWMIHPLIKTWDGPWQNKNLI